MIVSLVLLLVASLYGIRFGKEEAYEDYLSRDRTNAIKGIFILFVFLSHANGYLKRNGYEYETIGDSIFQICLSLIGQLMVVMFLFYSGYGVMESIKQKGDNYVRKMPRHRILTTLLNFDVAVCIFLMVNILIGRTVTLPRFLLSLIAWDSIGNSNWYIFDIIVCYFFTWLTAFLFPSLINKKRLGLGVMLSLVLVVIFLAVAKPTWWYDTLLAYAAGVFYSENKERIETLISKYYWRWMIIMTFFMIVLYVYPHNIHGFKMVILSIIFALWIVLLSMRVRLGNNGLQWCGANLFPLYIYQRIPMLVLITIAPASMWVEWPVLFFAICFIVTIIIAVTFKYWRITLN